MFGSLLLKLCHIPKIGQEVFFMRIMGLQILTTMSRFVQGTRSFEHVFDFGTIITASISNNADYGPPYRVACEG